MAGSPTLKNVWRPMVVSSAPDEAETFAAAGYLLCKVDRYGAGTAISTIKLLFSDYSGLEAEWEAGTATTVLDAAITDAVGSASWLTDKLTADQRALLGTTYTES